MPFLVGQLATTWPGALQAKQVIRTGWGIYALVGIIDSVDKEAGVVPRDPIIRVLSAAVEAWIKVLDKDGDRFFAVLAARDLAIRLFLVLTPETSSQSLLTFWLNIYRCVTNWFYSRSVSLSYKSSNQSDDGIWALLAR